MIRILLIRHGNTDLSGRVLYGRMPGVHLNPEGSRQAELLAQALKQRYAVDTIVSSPLERALETARAIAESYELPVNLDSGINEIDVGNWIGRSFHELSESHDWKLFNRQRATTWPPEGESLMEVQARAWRSIAALVERSPSGSTAAVITHGDVIRSILLLVLGISIDHIHRLEVAPASVTEISAGEHEPLVRCVNRVYY